MIDLYLTLDLIVVIALFVLGLTVLLKNRKLALNRIFSLFVISVGIWILANYISNDTSLSPHSAVIANYFVFTFSYSAALCLLWFSAVLANDNKSIAALKMLAVPLVLVGIVAATPLVG